MALIVRGGNSGKNSMDAEEVVVVELGTVEEMKPAMKMGARRLGADAPAGS